MVCKKEVINWFRDLSACRRIEFLCALMDCCGPLELRFLGTYIEELGRRDYDRLREMELNANDVNYLSKLINISDIRILDKVLTSLALMSSRCKDGARVLFKTLKDHTDIILNRACPREPCSETHEKVVLLAVMALNHPAFTFSEKQALRSQLSALLQAVESSVHCEDGADYTVKDIIYEYKEPKSQEISEVPDQQILSNEQDANDAVEDRQTDSNNDAVTILENDKNSSQDQDNPVFICNIEGKGLRNRTSDKRYEYKFMVHWTDNSISNISKTHGQLLDFQCKLYKLFPEEAGEQHQDGILPYLPGKRMFSTSHKGDLAEKMLPEIAQYAKQLSALPKHILHCKLATSFFRSSNVSDNPTSDTKNVAGLTNPTAAQEQDVKQSSSPAQLYQQVPKHIQQQQQQQQQQQFPLQDIDQQQLLYQQQIPTNSQQQQYHDQLLKPTQQQLTPPQPPPYPQMQILQQVPVQQVPVQQPLTQHQQTLQQSPVIHLQQQQTDSPVHQGQLQPGQQAMLPNQNQPHPVSTSHNQQLPHSFTPHPVEFFNKQEGMLPSKPKQVNHPQFVKYSKQQPPPQQIAHQPQLQQPQLQQSQLQQPQSPDSQASRRPQSELTPPTSHHNLTALVSQMHISQHHQVNLSTPNIPPAPVSNSNKSGVSGGMGICKQGTTMTPSIVTTTASSSSVYYHTVTSVVSIQSPPTQPYSTVANGTERGTNAQQFKSTWTIDNSKQLSNSYPPPSKHGPPTPTYTANLQPYSTQPPIIASSSHSSTPSASTNRSWSAPPSSNMAPPYSGHTSGNYTQYPPRDNVEPLIHEWLKKQRLHKYAKFFDGKTVEQVLQLSDQEVDSWDIVQGAKGRIKSQLEQLRQNGLSGLNGMSQLMNHPPPPFYYQGQLYQPPYNRQMLNQLCMPPVGNEGTGSEGSSSPSSPRDSSDENERESEGSEGSVLSSPEAKPLAGVNREPINQHYQQLTTQDNNGSQGTIPAQQIQPQFVPQMSPLPAPHGNPPQPGGIQGSPLSNPPINMTYNFNTVCPSPNIELMPTGPVDLRRLMDGTQRQTDNRLTPVPMMEMSNIVGQSTGKGGNGTNVHIGGSSGNGGSNVNMARHQVQLMAHLGDPNMMGIPPPNIPPPLPSHNQMDVGANISSQVVKQSLQPSLQQLQQQQQPQQLQQPPQQLQQPPQQQQALQQNLPGLQYSVECKDSNMFKMPSIVVPDVVPTSTVSPGPTIPSTVPVTPRNDVPPPVVSSTNSPRLLPSPINMNYPVSRAGFAPPNTPTTFAMHLGPDQYHAPTSVTYVTSMAQTPAVTLPSSYDTNASNLLYNNNNQTGYSSNPGCTSCGCSGQCGTTGGHHGPVHHFPIQSAYPSNHITYQNVPSYFPNLPGMAPPGNMMPSHIPGSPRFPGAFIPFQNRQNEMAYGGNGQLGMIPPGQMYLGGMNYGHRGNHNNHGAKKLTCYNCGQIGHRVAECREPAMDFTQNSYRLDWKPSESNDGSDS
ncbi:uncharacterized protein [Asterias amurensis]|uniref:uncharacterized protein n=1 Tax=Asterias amurensis TaxID=7602 RepID=UPI003AB2133A